MEDFRNRWAYSALAMLLAGISVFLYYSVYVKTYPMTSLLQWGGGAMALSALSALIWWPRHTQPSLRRVLVMGFFIPVFVTLVLSVLWSILNPGFPDTMRDGIETNINHIIQGGILIFTAFSIMTGGLPYLFGVLLSIPFSDPDID